MHKCIEYIINISNFKFDFDKLFACACHSGNKYLVNYMMNYINPKIIDLSDAIKKTGNFKKDENISNEIMELLNDIQEKYNNQIDYITNVNIYGAMNVNLFIKYISNKFDYKQYIDDILKYACDVLNINFIKWIIENQSINIDYYLINQALTNLLDTIYHNEYNHIKYNTNIDNIINIIYIIAKKYNVSLFKIIKPFLQTKLENSNLIENLLKLFN